MSELLNNDYSQDSDEIVCEFKGELSSENKHYIMMKQLCMVHKIVLFVGVIWTPFVIVLAMFLNLLWLYLLFGIILLEGLMLYCGIKIKVYPIDISITNDYIKILTKSSKGICTNEDVSVCNVSSIINFEKAYYINFKGTKSFRYCLCQKDLIQKGTIEEFEEMFARYIVKK